MIRRNSLAIFMASVLLIFMLVSCTAITTAGGDFDPVAAPYSYSFTEIDDSTLTLRLFVGSKDSRFTNPDNYSRLEIVSGGESFGAEISGPIGNEGSPGQINKRDIYMVTLPLTLGGGSGFEISDAYVNIRWRNGETDEIYIGDISFVLADSPLPQNDEVTFCALNPIGRIGDRDSYSLYAIALRINVSKDVLLKKVDLGLSKYGIDSNKILCFDQESDIRRVDGAITNKSIFDDYPSHFSLRTTNATSYDVGELLLTNGDNLLILPLVSSADNYNTIVSTGARLTYSIDGVEKSCLVRQKKMFDEFGWKINTIKELNKDAGNRNTD